MREVGMPSPLIAIANSIGPAVSPSGTAMFAPKTARNLARH